MPDEAEAKPEAKPKFRGPEMYSASKLLDSFMYAMEDAHAEDCNMSIVMGAEEGSDLASSDGDCNCGLQKVEEAFGKLEEAIGEVFS